MRRLKLSDEVGVVVVQLELVLSSSCADGSKLLHDILHRAFELLEEKIKLLVLVPVKQEPDISAHTPTDFE